MGYDEKLIKKLEDKAQKLRRDVVISLLQWRHKEDNSGVV